MIKLCVFVVVDVQQSFSCIFCRREGSDFSQFDWTWAERNPRLSYQLLQIIFTILLVTPMQIYLLTGSIPLYVIICLRQIARPHQNWTKCGSQDNLSGFNSLNRNAHIVPIASFNVVSCLFRYLKNPSWMLNGVSMLETGCGCHVVHFFRGRFRGTVLSMWARE